MDEFLDFGLAQTTLTPLNLRVKSANGVFIELADGRKLIDFISGIGVSTYGHGHPKIKQALHEQVEAHLHVMVYGEFRQSAQDAAAVSLLALLPSALDAVYFVNSGAEAIDGALKLARKFSGRKSFLSMKDGYHGNTLGALSISSNKERRGPFEPLMEGIDFIALNNFEDLQRIDGSHAAVIMETVQGDAGVRIPHQKWMHALRNRCDETGTLLILDEIQCGIGRTGKPFAFEHFGIVPDVLCLGKAIGAGVPMGAFVSSKEHMKTLAESPSLSHITTFGGHPLACAAAVAGFDLLKSMDWDEIESRGSRIEERIRAHGVVKEVRRIGYFIAVELDSSDAVHFCVQHALKNGLLIFYFLSTPQAFRIAPPLTMTDEEIDDALNILCSALDAWKTSGSDPY